jgi:hypothetical protein
MALTHLDSSFFRRGIPIPRTGDRQQPLATLAEVVPLRPEFLSQDCRDSASRGRGTKHKIAQVVASLRVQAPTRGTPPRSPSAPAPLVLVSTNLAAAPDGAA